MTFVAIARWGTIGDSGRRPLDGTSSDTAVYRRPTVSRVARTEMVATLYHVLTALSLYNLRILDKRPRFYVRGGRISDSIGYVGLRPKRRNWPNRSLLLTSLEVY